MVILIKHNGKIKTDKKPSKKYMKLVGKIAYDKYNSNYNKSVWEKKIIKKDGIKQVIYVLAKCKENNCNGFYIYDKRDYKVCNICGIEKKYQNNIEHKLHTNYNKNDEYKTPYNNLYKFSMYHENIKNRNNMWNNKTIEKLVYYKDKGSTELLERYDRVNKFEESLNKDEVNDGTGRGNKRTIPSH